MIVETTGRHYGSWHEWKGGEPPVNFLTHVTIAQRDGMEFDTELPHSWKGWEHTGRGRDIIAYRVITPSI